MKHKPQEAIGAVVVLAILAVWLYAQWQYKQAPKHWWSDEELEDSLSEIPFVLNITNRSSAKSDLWRAEC